MQIPLLIVREFFFVSIYNIPSNCRTRKSWGYEVVEIEYIIKIEGAQFLQAPGTISAQNLFITREREVERAPGCFHCVKEREPRRKFLKRENCTKFPY